MARDLARTNEVVYVTSLGVRLPRANLRDLRKVGHRLRLWADSCDERHRDARIISPLTLPLYNSVSGVRASGWLVWQQMKKAGIFNSSLPLLFWVGVPTAAPVISRLQGVPYFFHATDCQSAYPGVNKTVIAHFEDLLARDAKFCVTASEEMATKLKQVNPRTHWIEHSLEFDWFQQARPEPVELKSLPRPIFGYIGGITSWLDQDAIAVLAQAFPDASIVLVGRESVQTQKLRHLRNVHLLGPKPYGDIPGYISRFDVCMLPRKDNDWQRCANPLVILEYFALGKPVLAVDLPFVNPHRELFHLYRGIGDVAAAAVRALHEMDGLAEMRREVARARQHPIATMELSNYIEEYLGAR